MIISRFPLSTSALLITFLSFITVTAITISLSADVFVKAQSIPKYNLLCGMNDNVFEPEKAGAIELWSFENESSSCRSMTIRNCTFKTMFSTPFNFPPIFQELVIEDSVILETASLFFGFFRIDPNSKSRFIMKNVSFGTRSVHSVHDHVIRMEQWLVLNENALVNRTEHLLTRGKRWWLDPATRDAWENDGFQFARRNFLDEFVVESCLFSSASQNKFHYSEVLDISKIFIRGSLVVQRNNFRSVSQGFVLNRVSLLNGATLDVNDNSFVVSNQLCDERNANAQIPDCSDSTMAVKQLVLTEVNDVVNKSAKEINNADNMMELALRCSDRVSFTENFGTAVRLFNNHFSIKNKHVNNENVIAVADMQTGTCENNNNNNDNGQPLLLLDSENCGLLLVQNNTILMDYSAAGDSSDFGNAAGMPRAMYFLSISKTSKIKILNNFMNMTRNSRLAAVMFKRLSNIVDAEVGLLIEGNTAITRSEGQSALGFFSFYFDSDIGDKDLFEESSSSSSSSSFSHQNKNFSISQIVIRRNSFYHSLIYRLPPSPPPFGATVSAFGVRMIELFFVSKFMLSGNNFTMHLEVPRASTIAVFSMIGVLEGSTQFSNIPIFGVEKNHLVGTGTAHNSFVVVLSSEVFRDVGLVQVQHNDIDFKNMQFHKADKIEENLGLLGGAMQSTFYVYLSNLVNQQVNLVLSSNSGPDHLHVQNNSLTFVPPSSEMMKFSVAAVSIIGSGCVSPISHPNSGFPRFNQNFKLDVINNSIFAVSRSSSSSSSGSATTPRMYFPVTVIGFGGISDVDATWDYAFVEGNRIQSEVHVLAGIASLFGNFAPRNGAIFRRNSIIVDSTKLREDGGTQSAVVSEVYSVTRIDYVLNVFQKLFSMVVIQTLVPPSIAAFATGGVRSNSAIADGGSGSIIVDRNTYIIKDSIASVSFLSLSFCSLEGNRDDPSCGVADDIRLTNNNISLSTIVPEGNLSVLQASAPQLRKMNVGLAIEDNDVELVEGFAHNLEQRRQRAHFTFVRGVHSSDAVPTLSSLPSASLLSIRRNNIKAKSAAGASSSSGFSKITFVDQHLPVNTLFADNTLKIEGKTVAVAGSSDSVVSFLELPPIIDNRLQGQKFNLVFERNTIDNRSLTSSSSTSSIAFVSLKETSTTTTTTTSTSNDISISLAGNSILSLSFRNETTKVFDEFAIHNHLHRLLLLSSLRLNTTSSICNIIITGNDYDPREVNPNFTRLIAEFGATDVSSAEKQDHDDLEDSCSHFPWNNAMKNDSLASRTLTTNANKNANDNNNFSPILTDSNNALGSLGLVSATVAAPFVPSAAFGIARQQAMLNFVQNSRNGDCSGISSTDGVPPADSPTQMSIGDSKARLFVGGAVGNVVLSLALLLLVLCCGSLFLKKTGSSSWNRPYAVFARCHGAMILFICMSLLFAPTVKFGLVAATIAEVPVGEKVLAVFFGVVVFTSATVYYTYWSLVSREKKEAYRKVHHQGKGSSSGKPSSSASFLSRAFTYWFEGPGEWRMPMKSSKHGKDLTEKHLLDFDAATPMIDGFQGHAWYFGAVEFAVQFGLSFGEFLAQVVPANKSCVTTAVALVVVLVVYLFLCLWLRPFQERFNRVATPIITLFQVVVVVVALAFQEDQPAFIVDLAVAVMSMQSLVVVLILISSLSPLSKSFLKIYKRLTKRSRNPSKKNSTTSSMFQQFTNLSTLMMPSEVVQRGSSSNKIHQRRKGDFRDPDEKELLPTQRKKSEDNKRRDHHQSRRRDPDDAVSQRRNAVDTRKPSARPAPTDNNNHKHKHERRESRSGHREEKTKSRDELVKTNRNRSSHDARSSHPRYVSSSSRNRHREDEAKSRQPASSLPVRTRSNAEQQYKRNNSSSGPSRHEHHHRDAKSHRHDRHQKHSKSEEI